MVDRRDRSRESSRIPGFYKHSLARRRELLADKRILSPEAQQLLDGGGGLDLDVADRMSENVVACHGLPLSLALNFRVNQRDYIVPMAIEEPSVVAAASNAARMVRIMGGFEAHADRPIMTAQIQFDDVSRPGLASQRVMDRRIEILEIGNAAIPRMVARGGGCLDLEVRDIADAPGILVVHIYIDVGDAMGANVVDSVAEAVAPRLHDLIGGHRGLRILSNLPLRRMVWARACVSDDAIGGTDVADGIVRACRFAMADPLRAATHNKGVMNGVDAVALALGQDWRSIEAGAHAFAAMGGRYGPLTTWRRTAGGLSGRLAMPLAVASVGGATHVHPGVRAAFEIIGVTSARELATVMAAAGLASNLAALRAIAAEGIQRGHMALHNRRLDAEQRAPQRAGAGSATTR